VTGPPDVTFIYRDLCIGVAAQMVLASMSAQPGLHCKHGESYFGDLCTFRVLGIERNIARTTRYCKNDARVVIATIVYNESVSLRKLNLGYSYKQCYNVDEGLKTCLGEVVMAA